MDAEAHNASWCSIKRPCTGREFYIELIMTVMCVAALRQSLSKSMRLISINWDDLLYHPTPAVAVKSTRARRKIEIWKVSQHRQLTAEFTSVAHTFKWRLRSNKHCSRGHSLSSYGHLSNPSFSDPSRETQWENESIYFVCKAAAPTLFIRTASQIIVHRGTDRHNKRLWTAPLSNRHYRALLFLNCHFL